jgi:hypothetical protein
MYLGKRCRMQGVLMAFSWFQGMVAILMFWGKLETEVPRNVLMRWARTKSRYTAGMSCHQRTSLEVFLNFGENGKCGDKSVGDTPSEINWPVAPPQHCMIHLYWCLLSLKSSPNVPIKTYHVILLQHNALVMRLVVEGTDFLCVCVGGGGMIFS